jgi:hypothetical protein
VYIGNEKSAQRRQVNLLVLPGVDDNERKMLSHCFVKIQGEMLPSRPPSSVAGMVSRTLTIGGVNSSRVQGPILIRLPLSLYHTHQCFAPMSAMCVQRLNDSQSVANHINYRASLRSSSIVEPRHPSFMIVLLLNHRVCFGRHITSINVNNGE